MALYDFQVILYTDVERFSGEGGALGTRDGVHGRARNVVWEIFPCDLKTVPLCDNCSGRAGWKRGGGRL